jgi:hypothetical protein
MESHKKILGIILIISGSLNLLVLLLLNMFLQSILTFAKSQAAPDDAQIIEMVMTLLDYLPLVVIVLFAIPSLVAGAGLLARKKWAVIVSLVVGCLKLFSFPVGTAIGIYAIWIYSEDQRLVKQASPQ